MKQPKILSDHDYTTLTIYGHVVPRNEKTGETRTDFAVSKEYIVKSKRGDKPLSVRCTQNCPVNLKLIPAVKG